MVSLPQVRVEDLYLLEASGWSLLSFCLVVEALEGRFSLGAV